MPMPEGHYHETYLPHEPRVRSARERWIAGFCALLTAVVVAATLFSLTSHQATSGHGCVDFNYTIVMGGENVHECGQQARHLCASPPQEGGLGEDFPSQLRDACHKARIPYKTAT
jgi:hypothetical protein